MRENAFLFYLMEKEDKEGKNNYKRGKDSTIAHDCDLTFEKRLLESVSSRATVFGNP